MIECQTVWGWQIALYLFLGGLGGGAIVAAAIADVVYHAKQTKMVAATAWFSLVCLAVGLLLLLSEVGVPLRAMLLWQSFSHFASWMTLGAWVLFITCIVLFVLALIATDRIGTRLIADGSERARVTLVLAIIAAVGGLFITVYTGVLLTKAEGVAFWHTNVLPFLFTMSALDTGVAAVELISLAVARSEESAGLHRGLSVAVIVLVLLEALAFILLFKGALTGNATNIATNASAEAAAAYSADLILTGSLAPTFWTCCIAIGLAFPLVGAIVGLAHAKSERIVVAANVIGGCGALLGGCVLRFIILFAGAHAPILANSVMNLLL